MCGSVSRVPHLQLFNCIFLFLSSVLILYFFLHLRYMRIDEKHQCLSYYKSSAPGESPAGMIDLKVVKDITPYEKGALLL